MTLHHRYRETTMKKFIRLAWAAVTVCDPLAAAHAQPPVSQKPVRIIVPFSAGGIVDSVARLVGDKLSR